MTIATGFPIIASDLSSAIASELPEYVSYIDAGLKGKRFVASSQRNEFVLGCIAALYGSSGAHSHLFALENTGYTFVETNLIAAGVIAGNAVRAPTFVINVATALGFYASVANCEAAIATAATDNITFFGMNPATLVYGYVYRIATNDGGVTYRAQAIGVYGLP